MAHPVRQALFSKTWCKINSPSATTDLLVPFAPSNCIWCFEKVSKNNERVTVETLVKHVQLQIG